MKKIFIYSAMAAVLALGNTSCSDFLEVKPAGSVRARFSIKERGRAIGDRYVCKNARQLLFRGNIE